MCQYLLFFVVSWFRELTIYVFVFLVADVGPELFESFIIGLQVIECVAPKLSPLLHPSLHDLLESICDLLSHHHKGIRHMAGRALAAIATIGNPSKLAVIEAVVNKASVYLFISLKIDWCKMQVNKVAKIPTNRSKQRFAKIKQKNSATDLQK